MYRLGVLIASLGGNEKTVDTVKSAIGKTIQKVWLDEEKDMLIFHFSDGTGMYLFDDGQSCCESRYMRTDDDLKAYSGARLLDLELKDGPSLADPKDIWDENHDTQFLDIITDKGTFQMVNHNEHNGYYGGFWIVVKPLKIK